MLPEPGSRGNRAQDVYVLRHSVNGVVRYEGFVGGTILTGVDALGNTVSASVPASSICWDTADSGTDRRLDWFGETFNRGDSMGGWVGPGLPYPANCPYDEQPTIYVCSIHAADKFWIQTPSR